MKEFNITARDGKAAVTTPYNPDFVRRVKALGGKWDSSSRTWQVREEAVEGVRAAMQAVYGRTDAEPAATVTVVVKTKWALSALCGPFCLFGKVIARAYGRDSGAKVGDDVAFLAGQPTSSGSAKNWTTLIPGDAVIEIYGVAEDFARREIARLNAAGEDMGYTAEIKGEAHIDREALQAERERLLARLAEIDKILGGGE